MLEAFSRNLTPEEEDAVAAFMESVNEGKSQFNFQTAALHKNGTRVFLSVNCRPMRDESGHLLGITGTAMDVTPWREAEAVRNRVRLGNDSCTKLKRRATQHYALPELETQALKQEVGSRRAKDSIFF